MYAKRLILSLFLLAAPFGGEANAFSIRKCSGAAALDLNKAYTLIVRERDAFLAQWNGKVAEVNAKQRNKTARRLMIAKANFIQKLPRISIICKEDAKACVSPKKNVWAWVSYRRRQGRKVRVCYYRMARASAAICNLVGIIVHEIAHLAGVPSQKGHNKNPGSIAATDAVYLFGDSARVYCESRAAAGIFVNSVLLGKSESEQAVGAACSFNSQCMSGKCGGPEGDQICVCTRNDQCEAGKSCARIALDTDFGVKKLDLCS